MCLLNFLYKVTGDIGCCFKDFLWFDGFVVDFVVSSRKQMQKNWLWNSTGRVQDIVGQVSTGWLGQRNAFQRWRVKGSFKTFCSSERTYPLKTKGSLLKIDSWKMIHFLLNGPFSGDIRQFSRGIVSENWILGARVGSNTWVVFGAWNSKGWVRAPGAAPGDWNIASPCQGF